MENHSLVSRLIGGPENVRAAECAQRFNAQIGHALFRSLFQHNDIVGKGVYETTTMYRMKNKSSTRGLSLNMSVLARARAQLQLLYDRTHLSVPHGENN